MSLFGRVTLSDIEELKEVIDRSHAIYRAQKAKIAGLERRIRKIENFMQEAMRIREIDNEEEESDEEDIDESDNKMLNREDRRLAIGQPPASEISSPWPSTTRSRN